MIMTKLDGMLYNTSPLIVHYTGKRPRKAKRITNNQAMARTYRSFGNNARRRAGQRDDKLLQLNWRLA